MRVGIDARMLGYSGIGRYTENLIKQLANIDNQNEYLIFTQKRKNFQIPSQSNFKTVKVDAPIYSIKEQSNFLMSVNAEKLDVMHFTHFNRPILYTGKSILTIHDLTPIYFPGKKRTSLVERLAYRLVLKTALKKATKIIAVTDFTKKDLLNNFSFLEKNKIEVIYEGVEGNLGSKISKEKNQKFKIKKSYLLYVGLWREHKNVVGLIRAFEKIKKGGFEKLKLVIGGKPDPYYPEIREAQKNSKFKKDIILTGYIEDSDLPGIYKNAEVFIFPSFYEGFGLPPLEAMAFGCPVVSSNATCLPEVLGRAAIYFNPYDIDEMASGIKKVLNDKKLKKYLIAKGKDQIKKYSFKKMAKQTLAMYNEINKSKE